MLNVAIIGKPNAGKSSLFNILVDERISIVSEIKGVTRDRIFRETTWNGKTFNLIDTAGLESRSFSKTKSKFDDNDSKLFYDEMKEQVFLAIDVADLIIFLLDAKTGITDEDFYISSLLKKYKKKILVTVNKIDSTSQEANKYEFYNLGLGEPIAISALNKIGIGDFLDEVVNSLPKTEEEKKEVDISLCVVGKPNVGKSTLVNLLINEKRSIVSNMAGTTRDSINSYFKVNNKVLEIVDTAGIRKKAKVSEKIEKYSIIRALNALEKCDLALVVVDAVEGINEQDKKIISAAVEANKGIIVIVNKWDLVDKKTNTMKEKEDEIRQELKFASYAKIIFISATNNKRINTLIESIFFVYENLTRKVKTHKLNDVIYDAVLYKEPGIIKGKRLKIYYTSQISINPVVFEFKVNDNTMVHFSYKNYLENQIRKNFVFEGVPIKFNFSNKKE